MLEGWDGLCIEEQDSRVGAGVRKVVCTSCRVVFDMGEVSCYFLLSISGSLLFIVNLYIPAKYLPIRSYYTDCIWRRTKCTGR